MPADCAPQRRVLADVLSSVRFSCVPRPEKLRDGLAGVEVVGESVIWGEEWGVGGVCV